MTKVLVCGGRDFRDVDGLTEALNKFHKEQPVSLLIHGAARGADGLAGLWANLRGIACRPYPADWSAHGRAAGPIRNKQMLDDGDPDVVIAFPGGAGTRNMADQALRRGVDVVWPMGRGE